MNSEELDLWLVDNKEKRNLEFKTAMEWKGKPNKQKIALPMMAMSNLRDGGLILIGVEDCGTIVGLTEQQLDSYNYDDVAAFVNSHADPHVNFELSKIKTPNGNVVAIRVYEFDEIPVICRKDGTESKEGAIYIRSRGKIETTSKFKVSELREVLDLAIQKGVRQRLKQMQDLGVLTSQPQRNVYSECQDAFFKDSPLFARIQERGHWIINVQPKTYKPNRFKDLPTISNAIQKSRVRYHGWPYPYIDGLTNGIDWIENNRPEYYEMWRLHQSGQFMHTFRFWDERERDDANEQEYEYISFAGELVYAIADFFEFWARLSHLLEYEYLDIDIRLCEMKNRYLKTDSRSQRKPYYQSNIDTIPYTKTYNRLELQSDAIKNAVDAIIWFAERFNANIDRSIVLAKVNEHRT